MYILLAEANSVVGFLHIFFVKNALFTNSLNVGENGLNELYRLGIHNAGAAEAPEMGKGLILGIVSLVSRVNSRRRKLVANALYKVLVGHKRLHIAFPVKPIFGVVLVSSLVMEPRRAIADILP
jgi:hypothetical protein